MKFNITAQLQQLIDLAEGSGKAVSEFVMPPEFVEKLADEAVSHTTMFSCGTKGGLYFCGIPIRTNPDLDYIVVKVARTVEWIYGITKDKIK